VSITIRYFAAAKAALGTAEEVRDAAGSTIGALMTQLATDAARVSVGSPAASGSVGSPATPRSVGSPATLGVADVSGILDRCSFILNRHATTDRATVLTDGDTLDVLPPFAGG
jgi:molybdopterin converting factor small subunit